MDNPDGTLEEHIEGILLHVANIRDMLDTIDSLMEDPPEKIGDGHFSDVEAYALTATETAREMYKLIGHARHMLKENTR